MANGIPINSEILRWARETAGYSLEQMLRKFPKIIEWEENRCYPTYPQLEALSLCYKRPIAVFFFSKPPEETSIEKSLRTTSEEDVNNLTPQVRFLFRKAKAFQFCLKELFADEYENQFSKINWLKQNTKKPINKLAQEIRNALNISFKEQSLWADSAQALEEWRNLLAKNGVYVFKDAFKDSRVSGFCIYDSLFPIIFLNNSLSKNRQIFTIFHELAHLIYKQNYLDMFDDDFLKLEDQDTTHIEVKCNNFAGHFLVPDESFLSQVPVNADSTDYLEDLAKFYKVSEEVILRKLLTTNRISKESYKDKLRALRINFEGKTNIKNKKSRGNFYFNKLAYLGGSYSSLIFEKYYQDKINIEKASEYLDIKIKSFSGIEETYLKKSVSDVRI